MVEEGDEALEAKQIQHGASTLGSCGGGMDGERVIYMYQKACSMKHSVITTLNATGVNHATFATLIKESPLAVEHLFSKEANGTKYT